jgi:hypothetical protein
VLIRSVSLVALSVRLYLLIWYVLDQSFPSYSCLTPTINTYMMKPLALVSQYVAVLNKNDALSELSSPSTVALPILVEKW